MNVLRELQQIFHRALAGLVDDPAPYLVLIRLAQDPRHGDYQANCAMPLAKVLGRKPQEIAREIAQRVDRNGMLEEPAVAGPGFINLRLCTAWLAAQLQKMARDERLGVERADSPKTYVVDYSSPNVAKPMHVGHLRSTIIGDALARLLRFLGHQVITDNHLGDWGTQFGILLYGYKHYRDDEALRKDPVREMARLYVLLRNLMRASEEEGDSAAPSPAGPAPSATGPGVKEQGIHYELGERGNGSVVTFAASDQPAGPARIQEGAFAYTVSVSENPPEDDILSSAGDTPDLQIPSFPPDQGSAWPGSTPTFSQLIPQDMNVAFTYRTGDPVTDRLAEDLTNPAVVEAARQETAKLHAGNP